MIAPIIIINGPTAVGKTTVIKRILQRMPQLQTATTYTTRPLRKGQREDKKIIHVSEKEFQTKIEAGALLEWSKHYGNFYGTAKKSITDAKGKPLLLNIGFAGPKIIKKIYSQAFLIFIRPESMKQIKQRLLKRGITSSEFKRRYGEAIAAMKEAKIYDYQVTNHEGKIGQTVSQIERLIRTYLKSSQLEPIIDKKTKKR